MTLTYPIGVAFTTGEAQYLDTLTPGEESTPKIFISIEIEGQETTAEVDTGGVYVFLNPEIVELLDLRQKSTLDETEINMARGLIRGDLYRLNILFLAEQGNSLPIESTAFIPKIEHMNELQNMAPVIIGYQGCLERLKFAVDPGNIDGGVFYFGET